MLKKIGLISLSAIIILLPFLLSGCANKDLSEEIAFIPASKVAVMSLGKYPEYLVSEIGVIKPVQEIEVYSKSSGTADNIYVGLGDTIESGQVIAVIDSSKSDIASRINLDNARNQLDNALKNADEISANNESSVYKAQLRADNLQASINKLQRNAKELRDTNIATIKSLELQVDIAEKNAETAETAYKNTLLQFNQSREYFYTNTDLALEKFFTKSHLLYRNLTEIINPENRDFISSSDLYFLFGARNFQQKNDFVNLYNSVTLLNASEEDFYYSSLPLNDENLVTVLERVYVFAEKMDIFMKEARELFDNSSAGNNLSYDVLKGYRTALSADESVSSVNLDVISRLKQSYDTLNLNENTQVITAENSLSVSESRFSDAENSLIKFNNTAKASIRDIEVQIEQIKVDIESSKQDIASLERTRDVQDQSKELELQTLRNQVRSAERSLADNKITASSAGILSELNIDQGDYVTPGFAVGKIIQYKNVKIIFYVDEKTASSLSVNYPVSFRLSYDSNVFSGVIAKIAPSADSVNKKVRVEAFTSNNDLFLKPETFVNVELDISEKVFNDEKIYIPLNAVIIDQSEKFVFVSHNSVAQKRIVKTGEIFDKWIEITDGLIKDDLLIVDGHRNLDDGVKVQF